MVEVEVESRFGAEDSFSILSGQVFLVLSSKENVYAPNMELKDWVKAARKSVGLTQEQLGEKLGRTKANVGHWETGKHEPSFDQMRRISEITGYAMPGATGAALPGAAEGAAVTPAPLLIYPVRNVRPVWVCGTCQGGMPEVIHEGWPEGEAQEYAEVSTTDEKAFVCRVVGDSMVPRYQPGEYALVEPSTTPEIEDDVLVRLRTGESMLKRLIGKRGGIRLASYNDQTVITLREDEVSWIYYVAHPVPAKKIKQRSEMQPIYAGPERRKEQKPVPVDLRTMGWYYSTEGRDPEPRESIEEQLKRKGAA